MSGGNAARAAESAALGVERTKFLRGQGGANREGAKGGGERGVRYRLLSLVQRLFYNRALPPDRQDRVCSCHFRRKASTVKIRQDTSSGRAHYTGLETCRNVWACPVCNGTITEERRKQLQRAASKWKKKGGELYLATGTFPHGRLSVLKAMLGGMAKAMKIFNDSPRVKRWRKAGGYIGYVRALEVTWGSWHGWHPHFHFLIFAAPGQRDALRALEAEWAAAVIKAGLATADQLNDMLHGADGEAACWDVQHGDYATDYIAKYGHEPSFRSRLETGETWGIDREMVRGMAKIGRRLTGITPFTLLAVVAGVTSIRGADGRELLTKGRATALFLEFALAFKRQRQLYWSPRLADTLEMGELFSDEELPDALDAKPEMRDVCELSADDWRLVLQKAVRDKLLRVAEEGGERAVRAFLRELRGMPDAGPPGVSRWSEEGGYCEGVDSPRAPSLPLSNLIRVEQPDGTFRSYVGPE